MANSIESFSNSILNLNVKPEKVTEKSIFFPNMCHICRCFGEKVHLKRCSSCNMISYCSKEHQKQDWRDHKQFCKILCEMKKAYKVDNLFDSLKANTEEERMAIFKEIEDDGKGDILVDELLVKATALMKRKLKSHESLMIKFPRVCSVCYESRNELLINCKNCPQVTFCKEHLLNNSAHEEQCPKFILNSIFKPTSVMTKVKDVKLCPQMKIENFPSSMLKFLETCVTKDSIDFYSEETSDLLHLVFSEKYSRPLSLVFALKKLDFPENLEKLVIHVVGASLPEQMYNEWEIIVHYFKSVQKLSVLLIGNELLQLYNETEELCESCRKKQKEVTIESHVSVYDEYCRQSNFKKPDIIACFNAGFHFYPTWEKSIKTLKKGQCPLVVTAFSKAEGLREEEIVKSIFPAANCVFSDCNPFESYNYTRRKTGIPLISVNQFISIYKQLGAENTSK